MRVVVQRVSYARVTRDVDDAGINFSSSNDAGKDFRSPNASGNNSQISESGNNSQTTASGNNRVNALVDDHKTAGDADANNTSSVNTGLLVLLGIETGDYENDVAYLTGKISRLRIFDDENGVMNLSVMDIKGEFLVISQFTLHAETKKGNRPSYIRAARPEQAIPLYELFLKQLHDLTGLTVKAGWFGARMKVELANEGPVTIIMDSK